MAARDGEFDYEGHRIAYTEHGEGEATLVLIHGLLMNGRMYDGLAPEMASRGIRVITIDLLGHGRSDGPRDMRLYSMTRFGEQVAALIDHLGLDRPVVGGTSLGANASLEFAVHHPGKARALMIEMPVLDNALLGAALAFTPVLLGLRFGKPVLRLASALTRRVPRTHHLVDIGLDWARRDPEVSRAVLEGLLFSRTAPPHEERMTIAEPALVFGHPGEPLHPFSDAGMLVDEIKDARLIEATSILEWRISPSRLDDQLAAFIEDAYAGGGGELAARRTAA